MFFSFVKTFNAFATHEKKEVYSQIPWNGERDIIYFIFLNHRVWNGNLKHFSTMHPSFLNLHPFTFPPPLTFLYFTLCLLFSKYRNEPLVTLPLTTVPLNILISTAKNCAELHKCAERISGVYSIDPDGSGPFEVYCDQTTAGGGWTVFQRRLDGCLDFNRDWADYKHGFGNFLIGEYWLGLDKIYRLTQNETENRLRVDLGRVKNKAVYTEYSWFGIGDEKANYQLNLGNIASESISFLKAIMITAATTTSSITSIRGTCISPKRLYCASLLNKSFILQHSSRYEPIRKFIEHERCVRVARFKAECNSSFTIDIVILELILILITIPSPYIWFKWYHNLLLVSLSPSLSS